MPNFNKIRPVVPKLQPFEISDFLKAQLKAQAYKHTSGRPGSLERCYPESTHTVTSTAREGWRNFSKAQLKAQTHKHSSGRQSHNERFSGMGVEHENTRGSRQK